MSRLLVLTLVLAGFTALASSEPPKQSATNAGDKKAAAVKAGPAAPRSYLQTLLAPVDFAGETNPKRTLVEVLDTLSKRHNLPYQIMEKAFRFEMLLDVAKTEVANPKPIPPMKAPLGKVIARILERVSISSGATFLLREDGVEITTGQFVNAEINLSREKVSPEAAKAGALGQPLNPVTGRSLIPLDDEKADGGGFINLARFNVAVVSISIDQQPLEEAIRQMRAQVNVNVAFDPSLGAKAKTPLTVTLLNSPLDTALRLLTEMLELDYVWLDNIFYVTSQEKAKKLRTTWPRRRSGGAVIATGAGAGAGMD